MSETHISNTPVGHRISTDRCRTRHGRRGRDRQPHNGADAPRTFVLVHGAYEGGWIWRTSPIAAGQGSQGVHADATGLGERSHLMSGMITLDTHITDVANVIKWERLENSCWPAIPTAAGSSPAWSSGRCRRFPSSMSMHSSGERPEGTGPELARQPEGRPRRDRQMEVSSAPDYSRDNSPMMTAEDRDGWSGAPLRSRLACRCNH